jgi:hypothetical protein
MHHPLNRRRFLRGSLVGAATAGFVSLEERRLQRVLAGEGDAARADAALKAPAAAPLPSGKIGKLTISRLIAGAAVEVNLNADLRNENASGIRLLKHQIADSKYYPRTNPQILNRAAPLRGNGLGSGN